MKLVWEKEQEEIESDGKRGEKGGGMMGRESQADRDRERERKGESEGEISRVSGWRGRLRGSAEGMKGGLKALRDLLIF